MYDFIQRATTLGFSKKLEAAKQTVIVSGRPIRLVKHLRSDEWEVVEGETWLEADVVVTPKGRVLPITLVGRKAIAEAV